MPNEQILAGHGFLHPSVREVYRDDVLWALDKPAGILSHPNPPGKTASNALFRGTYDYERELYRLEAPGAPQIQVHLIHRLDLETSGLLLCAFTARAASILKEALFHRQVTKEYRALLVGSPPSREGEWADRLEKVSEEGRATVRAGRGKPNAVTVYRVLEHLNPQGLSLVSLRPETGRTHQLRVQTASRGHPIAGDKRYGDLAANKFLELETGLKSMFLHACRLELRHPATGHRLKLEAPLGVRLAGPLERARALGSKVPKRK